MRNKREFETKVIVACNGSGEYGVWQTIEPVYPGVYMYINIYADEPTYVEFDWEIKQRQKNIKEEKAMAKTTKKTAKKPAKKS